MEIGRGIGGAEQGRRVHRPGTGAFIGRRDGADVVRLPVKEVGARDVATGAGAVAESREGRVEDRFAAQRSLGCGFGQLTVRCQHGIRQEVELKHVGDESVQHEGGRFVPAELIDDHVAGEIAQGSETAVATIGTGETQAAKARDVERVVTPVVEDRVEKGAVDVDRARLVAGTGDEEPLVDVRAVVTGRAREPEVARRAAEYLRAVEQHVAVGDKRQIDLVDALFLEVEDKTWQRVLIEDVGARRQARRYFDGATAEDGGFGQGAQRLTWRKILNEIVLRDITGDYSARGRHRVAVS